MHLFSVLIEMNSVMQICIARCLRFMNGYTYDLWECSAAQQFGHHLSISQLDQMS